MLSEHTNCFKQISDSEPAPLEEADEPIRSFKLKLRFVGRELWVVFFFT